MAYPASLDSFTAKTDSVDDVMAADVNELQTAIVATETELGTDVAGSATDLKTRLAHSINDAGYLEFDQESLLTISSGAITVSQNLHRIETRVALLRTTWTRSTETRMGYSLSCGHRMTITRL